jgi:hypothetical protein
MGPPLIRGWIAHPGWKIERIIHKNQAADHGFLDGTWIALVTERYYD